MNFTGVAKLLEAGVIIIYLDLLYTIFKNTTLLINIYTPYIIKIIKPTLTIRTHLCTNTPYNIKISHIICLPILNLGMQETLPGIPFLYKRSVRSLLLFFEKACFFTSI